MLFYGTLPRHRCFPVASALIGRWFRISFCDQGCPPSRRRRKESGGAGSLRSGPARAAGGVARRREPVAPAVAGQGRE